MKHLLKIADLSAGEIISILNLADKLKSEQKRGIKHRKLHGKTLGMIFQKSSTRTRVSFEVGMYQLGGSALFLSKNDLQIARGEPVEDTARVLSRYVDCIMIRTFAQQEVEDLARFGSVPVINGLTDYAHPCQALACLMTMRERLGDLNGRKLCYIGDGNNVANSLIVAGIKTGMEVSVACPDGFRPDANIIEWAQESGKLTITDSPTGAASAADAVYTDVWSSMGMESEAQKRLKIFAGYQVNAKVMSAAKPGALALHCLPAHRGEEIDAETFEAHAEEIFDEAENRLHVQKAVLVELLRP